MITFRLHEKTVSGVCFGKPFVLPRTESIIDALQELKAEPGENPMESILALRKVASFDAAVEGIEFVRFNTLTGRYTLVYENEVRGVLPEQAGKDIVEMHSKDLDVLPIVKMWVRVFLNPQYNEVFGQYLASYMSAEYTDRQLNNELLAEGFAEEEAKTMSTYPDIGITEEGLLATYKVVDLEDKSFEINEDGDVVKVSRFKETKTVDPDTGEVTIDVEEPKMAEDFLFKPSIYPSGDKFYCGDKLMYNYKIGKEAVLQKESRRNYSHTFGGGGLYTGGFGYIESYANDSNKTLMAFVNPTDILSFQSEGHALRTNALFPHSFVDKDVAYRGKYVSSDYAKLSEVRINQMLAELKAIKEEELQKIADTMGLNVSVDE